PVADWTSATKRSSCWRASAADAGSVASARVPAASQFKAVRSPDSIIFTSLPSGNQDFTIAVGLHGRDQPCLFHLLEQPGGPVVADAQITLHGRVGSTPVLLHQFDRLIVQRDGYCVSNTCNLVYCIDTLDCMTVF